MISRLLSRIVGKFCEAHERAYTSDFCPYCVRARVVHSEVHDSRPAWFRTGRTARAGRIEKRSA
jgi:hypothetical protein